MLVAWIGNNGVIEMRIIEDVLCIVLLIVLPDWYLEKTGLYSWMYRIKEQREVRDDKV